MSKASSDPSSLIGRDEIYHTTGQENVDIVDENEETSEEHVEISPSSSQLGSEVSEPQVPNPEIPLIIETE